MWDHLKIGFLTIMFCACLPVYSSAASLVDGSSIQPAEQSMTITVRLDQWNTLKKELIAQENDLSQLKQKLQMLKSTSGEQMQLLENLQNELSATKKALQNANSSLTECQNALTESKASLQILKNQIKALEHKQVVTRRQRDVYALVAAISLGSVIAR